MKEHTEVMVQLGIQKEILVGISSHLVTLNGKVASQESRVGQLELTEAFQSGERGGAKTTIVAVWAVVSALGGAIGTTLISHFWH